MMNVIKKKKARVARRAGRVRAKINGSTERPRLSVFRSNRGMYLQLIDDALGRTLVSAHARELKDKGLSKTETASSLGKLIAEKAMKAGVTAIVFDRGAYRYHGRVKAVADGAREQGLVF
ncbi:50S ribosomal protein L18 [Candidatus Falkowbacteria bacterium HGW-Falkowbacteria-2]|uniref:Large ribosomal subunit protein uL18 n=1 Tax=Candidatus Falkowbacteria bacterium HGW-Falkowbacteria-2 TaxID=2013769 RepID=A0A2N2E331_9BACT|nr:MAG: 50S ribosomal protein L18 [Candidatus Falkowbacteria bacterium HGW-Falkowbacteria-2]